MEGPHKQTLKFQVWGASGLPPKDFFSRSSDPYLKLGFIDSHGAWVESPYPSHKADIPHHSVAPKWGLANTREYILPIPNVYAVKIEVWIKELLGKHLIGAVTVPMDKITTGSLNGLQHYDLVSSKSHKGTLENVGKLEVEFKFQIASSGTATRMRSNASRRMRLKQLRYTASEFIDKLGPDALQSKITNKTELLQALENLAAPPYIKPSNLFMGALGEIDSSFAPSPDQQAKEHADELKAALVDVLWDMFDLNHDGEITFQELILALSFQAESTPEKRARFYFKVFDDDQDGFLSEQEVLHMQQMLFRLMRTLICSALSFERATNAESGQVDDKLRKRWMKAFMNATEDMDVLQLPEKLTDEIMTTIDKNKDGHISTEEYTEFLQDIEAQKTVLKQFNYLLSKLKGSIEEVELTTTPRSDAKAKSAVVTTPKSPKSEPPKSSSSHHTKKARSPRSGGGSKSISPRAADTDGNADLPTSASQPETPV